MKLIRTNGNFIKVYDCNITDIFGHKIEVWHNEDMNEYRLMARNPDYKKERKRLDNIGCKNVVVPLYLEVIDITEKMLDKLNKLFPDVLHTNFQIWNEVKAI